jgi:hypothetical protein
MFQGAQQLRAKAATQLGELAARRWVRLAAAGLLVLLHLTLFAKAGRERFGLAFDTHPDEAPYFSNPDAPALAEVPRQPHRWSRLLVSRFDAQHYIATSVRGLTACPTDPGVPDSAYLDCGLGWLPAWGMIGGTASLVTHAADDTVLMGMSILAALVLNFLWTSPILVARIGRGAAWAALLGFNLYPSAFYLVTPYPEAATLALALGGFLALCSERWLIAALLVGAATALSTSALAFAVALGCALGVAAWQRRRARVPAWWRPLLALPLCAWGQLATMLALQLVLGDWRAFLRARAAFGSTHAWGRLFDVTYWIKGLASQNMDVVWLVAFIAILAFTARELLAKFSSVENVFLVAASALTIILAIVAPPNYWGITRGLMLCPMVFLGAGLMARQHTVMFVLWCVLCVAFYWHVELCGYLTQGDPQACPCLGRIEIAMPFGS